MTMEGIYTKYWQALTDVDAVMVPADTAIALALRLAVQDAYSAGAALCEDRAAIVASQAQPTPDQRQQESLQAQISQLNEWLEANATDQYFADKDTAAAVLAVIDSLNVRIIDQAAKIIDIRAGMIDAQNQLLKMDADNASLTQWLGGAQGEAARLRQEIADLREQVIPDYQASLAETHRLLNSRTLDLQALQAEVDRLTQQNVIAVGTLNSLTEVHSNGNGPADVPTWWATLDDETNDYRVSLDAGRRTFRQLDKRTRLTLVLAFIRHIGAGAMPTQQKFDAAKPTWMPGGTGLTVTFGCAWSELLTLTPFEVAP